MSDIRPIIVLGAATALEEVSDLVAAINEVRPCFKIVGALDDNVGLHGTRAAGVEVLGGLALASERLDVGLVFAISSYKLRLKRISLLENLGVARDRYVTLIHPRAEIASSARVGRGCAIFGNAVVAPQACVGDFSVVYNSAFVSAFAQLDDFALVAAHAFVGAKARVGKGAFVAGSATVAPGVGLGVGAMVALGSVAFEDVPAGTTVLGNPAKELRTIPVPAELL